MQYTVWCTNFDMSITALKSRTGILYLLELTTRGAIAG